MRQNQDSAKCKKRLMVRHRAKNDAAEKLCLRKWIYIADSSEVATFEITLPERNIAPARKPTKVTSLPTPIFQVLSWCYVRFREGKVDETLQIILQTPTSYTSLLAVCV